MRCFVLFSFMALATFGWSLNERISVMPTTIRNERQKSRRLVIVPKPGRMDMRRLLKLKHMLELNCIRHICNNAYCKHRGCRIPPEIIRGRKYDRGQQKQFVHYNRMRENAQPNVPNYRRHYSTNNRMLFVPPNLYVINPRAGSTRNNPSMGFQDTHGKNPKQDVNLINQNTENVIYIQVSPLGGESRTVEESQLPDDIVSVDDDEPKTSKQPNQTQPSTQTTTANLHSYRHQIPVNRLPQYEVKEIIDENLTEVNKSSITKHQLEMESDSLNINSSSLMNEAKNTLESSVVNKNISKSIDQTKLPQVTPPIRNFYSRGQKMTNETTPELYTNKTLQIPQQTETPVYNVSFITTRDKGIANLVTFPVEESSSGITPAATERAVRTSTQKQTVESRKPVTSSFVFSEIQTTAEVTTTSKKQEMTPTATEWTFPHSLNTSPKVLMKTVEYFSGATELSTRENFEEFTDQPLLFNLFPKIRPDLKKEPDAAWKNSRKMNFGEPKVTTKSNSDEQRRSDILITENADYFDYENNILASNYLEKLKENNSFLSLDPVGNLTSEAIIPLIPIVISDLREGKISEEAIPILSETFGKYWPVVLALSNSTNLDMLPLMKMKDERDLENVLRIFLPEEEQTTFSTSPATATVITTTTTTENMEADLNKNFDYDLYEYMDNLYKDFGEFQDVETTDKRKR